MRFIRYKREKQQINFLNCNELDKWVDTCQTRPTEFYDVCEDCCTSSIIEPISYWKADNVLVCGSELGSDYLSDHSYEKWIEYNKYDNSIISIDYRNGVPSCDCGYADYEWKYGDRTICGYELGDGYDQTSIYQVWEYVNGCDPTDIQAIEYRNPQKSCECGYRTLTMRVSDPLETKCYEPTGDTDPSIGYTYAKYYQWSICPDDPSYDEKTGVEEWRLIGRTCECGWVQKAFIPTEEYYCGSEIGKTSTTKYQKYVGVNICPEDESIIEYTGDYRYYSVESNSCDCGYDDKEWVFVSTGCSGTSSYELWNYIDKCANTVISSETRNVVANDCNCGAVNLTDWTYIGQVCGIELGDDYDDTYIYDKYVRYDTCDNSVYATEYRNGTYNEECISAFLNGDLSFEFSGDSAEVICNGRKGGYFNQYVASATTSPYSIALRDMDIGFLIGINFPTNLTKVTSIPSTLYVTDMEGMFAENRSLTSITFGEYFTTSNVTDMSSMFNGCETLPSLDVSSFDTSNVTNMNYMFGRCYILSSLNVSNFNTSNVTDMGGMFQGCRGLTSLDVSNFDTSNVTDMGSMFNGCSGLTSLDLSNFDTSAVTDMSFMFYRCSGLTSLDLSHFDTSKVTSMSNMFYGCSGLTTLDLSNFNTSKVTTMSEMFQNCTSLTSLDLSNFDTSSVGNITNMFWDCDNLKTIYMRGCSADTISDIEKALNNEGIKDQVTIITT